MRFQSSPLPRWPDPDGRGAGEVVEVVAAEVTEALTALAARWSVTEPVLLLAVHAKVVAALTGDPTVITSHRTGTGPATPVSVEVRDGSWAELVASAAAARTLPAADTRAETVLDTAGGEPDLTEHELLAVSCEPLDDMLRLRVRHRAGAVGADQAQRIAGYYGTALRALTSDPDADHRAERLISAREYTAQIDSVRERPLPPVRTHEVFERIVARLPDAVAAQHRDQRLTYRELNARANRVARGLRARGVRAEDVVAVVTERDLDWLVAVLAIFKAGAVYLPVEPHFPADRMATMLRASECRFVLTEMASTTNLTVALASTGGPVPILVAGEYAGDGDATDLGVEVGEHQLAYVYFTSGSTGAPKGAMCEHAGMLNHLFAKIDDLGIREGQVVAQTAPQCFDISLWQLVAPLLVGGRTLIVEQEAVLDVERYLERVVGGDVEVLQMVPSYLEVVLTQLEAHPTSLGRLRCVSVTGEAIKVELAARWFASYPDIALVNAYGLTETSDDTNHEVLRSVPAHDSVPLGRPVANIGVYVVDDRLEPVPLGAPGEIVFSGLCVGRGYINDETRTRESFVDDPHRPGTRLYRSGDFGRWLPGGTLGFAGRRDAQVKIRGFRIEIGEIDNQLLRVPGVADAAVVVTESPGGDKQLVAFFAARDTLTGDDVRAALAETLPEYMVPVRCHRLPAMPLTDNGKIDKKRLGVLAAERENVVETPVTPTARRLARAWADVLKVPVDRVGLRENFFELGGTSLSAVRLVIAVDRWFSLTELTEHPVLADLAEVLERRTDGPATAVTTATGFDVRRADRRPPVVEADTAPGSAVDWVSENLEALRAVVAADGAVLVRGLGIKDAAQVADVSRAVAGAPVPEREGFAPRQLLTEGVYSSSEWPADQPMCMHHELSYALEFPSLMVMGCVRAPAGGGVTGLADTRDVLAALPAEIVDRFERTGWLLARNYNGLVGVPWSTAFGVTERAEVEQYCRANQIEFTWDGDGLRTRQRRAAILHHPVTGERCWFNQIAFLNEGTLDPDVREFLTAQFGRDGLPFNSLYGDGTPIEADTVETINAVYESVTQREPWCDGDLMIVDNIRMAHSREPYTGQREVLVSMAGPVRLADCRPALEDLT
ncbi:hypothetical protein BLA60_21255 [Actinophytocola xinjiangensis]|uniref:Carrier domain-containing protein n=1 Tax=Actinophytocola xinjiangensis TaxID=485602 RepID=A0A7Z0WKW9_9PSEU|nr:amino acid adenylation domain-containing protein [Actinophytocola xinjiangensis]OLF09109.1 hypothetical protein BLA60_21255 [Actinophytocola xinjiangensis]